MRGRGIRSGSPSSCVLAARKFGLERVQARLCRKTIEVMPHVQQAAMLAVETCQKVFEYRRWNCSSTERAPQLTPDLLRGKILTKLANIKKKQKNISMEKKFYENSIQHVGHFSSSFFRISFNK